MLVILCRDNFNLGIKYVSLNLKVPALNIETKAIKINTAQKFQAWVKLHELKCNIKVFSVTGIQSKNNKPFMNKITMTKFDE